MRNARPVAIVSLAVAFFSLPIIFYGFPILGHDGPVHLLYCREFSKQFWSGELYPRWLMGTHNGFGSPAFFVYAPVPYWITAMLAPLGRLASGKPPGYVELSLSALLALWTSGIAAYFWLKRFCAETAAIVGAVVYLASPYHLVVDLYMRAAFAEFWAFAWMPLVLFFTEGVMLKKRYALIGAAASYALLVMTHLLTALIFSPIPIAYALFLSKRGERLQNIIRLSASLLLGLGLSAIYLFPALDHKSYVSTAKYLLAPIYQWYMNFPPLNGRLFQVEGSWPSFVQFIALLWIMFAIAVICFATLLRPVFWVAVAAASLFMMLPLSAPVWRLLPVLAQLQLPWRFQTALTLAVAALAATSAGMRWSKIALPVVCLMAALSLGFFGYMSYRISQQDRDAAWRSGFSNDPFLSDWTSSGVTDEPVPQVRFESGRGSARIERWSSRDIRLRLRSDRESSLLIHQFYYQGWTASAGAVAESSERGLIRIKAPPGDYELDLWLDGGRMERIGMWVSALCLAILPLLACTHLVRT